MGDESQVTGSTGCSMDCSTGSELIVISDHYESRGYHLVSDQTDDTSVDGGNGQEVAVHVLSVQPVIILGYSNSRE